MAGKVISLSQIFIKLFFKKKYENNINVKLFQKAVSDRNYETDFIMFGNRILSQGNRIVESVQDSQTEKTYKVQVIDLCEFIENEILTQHKRIYFLKLDIEGMEFEIMKKIIEKKIYKKLIILLVKHMNICLMIQRKR